MTNSSLLDELLVRWQELRRTGGSPPLQEVCAGCPELADELARRVAAFESMEAMLGLNPSEPRAPRGSKPGVPAHLAEKLRPLGYELLEVIDQGGMGVVYKAVQVELRRTVALKMIAGFRAGPKQLARFRVEAEAVARLHHPHIVQIYDIGEVDGHSFFTMEYVPGGTLAHLLEAGPLDPRAAAHLVETLARAVHHAHTRGIIHRDLKPANILLTGVREGGGEEAADGAASGLAPDPCSLPPPVPKVSDFGLAKRVGADSDHTATGEVIGTPTYMAPEQALGQTSEIGTACDIYAVGAILYEVLTGRPPFKGNTVLETLRQVISDEPTAPRRLRPAVPRDLEAICLKCLEKNPGRRYASADALADDLQRFANGLPVVARHLSVFGRGLKFARRHPIGTAALLLVLLAVGGAVGHDYADRVRERNRLRREEERKRQRAIEVAPQAREILHRHCYECHGANPAKVERGFHVFDRASLYDPARRNVLPGRPEDSRLLHRIEDNTMPPERDDHWLPRVTAAELTVLREWIAGGAPELPPEDPHNPTPPVVPRSELAERVRVIFETRCASCHRLAETRGGIKILNHDLLVTVRKVVVPGKPEESEVYQLLVTPDESQVMPPPGEPGLTPAEIETVRQWIAEGAPPFPHAAKK